MVKKRVISVLLVLLLALEAFSGCSSPVQATFEYGNDEEDYVIKVNSGVKIDAPDQPVKAGFTFMGWFDADTDEQETFPYILKGDKIFYAKWQATSYTVSFVNMINGISHPYADKAYTIENALTLGKPGDVDGYEFMGWYADAAYSGAAVAQIAKGTTGNKTFYAKWEILVDYTLTLNSPTYPIPETIVFNRVTASSIAFPDISGSAPQYYRFAGWSKDAEGTQFITALPDRTEENVEIYAIFVPVEYEITYILNGGSFHSVPVNKFTAVAEFTLSTYPVKDELLFAGWYDNPELNGDPVTKLGSGTEYLDNVVLYAKWKELSAEEAYIEYVLNGGSLTGNYPVSYIIGTGVELPIPVYKGYTFEGWYTAASGGEKAEKVLPADTGNKTFYARWSKDTYTINYVLNSGALSGNYKTVYDVTTSVILPAGTGSNGIVKRDAYAFAGWYSKEDFSGSPVSRIDTGNAGNITFYAKWTPVQYYIFYNYNDGRPNSSVVYDIESPDIVLPTLEREHYDFIGWYATSDFSGSKITVLPGESYGNRDYYAKWQGHPYTVTYVLNSGTGVSNETHRVGDAPYLPVPTRANYTFGGWYTTNTNIDNLSARDAYHKLDAEHFEDITFYAKWVSGNPAAKANKFEAVYTENLSLKPGIGYSGNAYGLEAINAWTIGGQVRYTVGCRHSWDLSIVDYVVYSDRYVTNAALSITLGSENPERTYFDSNSIVIIVNGKIVDWSGRINTPCGNKGRVDTLTTATIGNITLLPGKNTIELYTGDDWGGGGVYVGPDVEAISINTNATLTWDPILANLNKFI